MQDKVIKREEWLKTLLKLVSNPTLDVAAAMVVVVLATWFLVQSEPQQRAPHLPVLPGK